MYCLDPLPVAALHAGMKKELKLSAEMLTLSSGGMRRVMGGEGPGARGCYGRKWRRLG